MEEKIYWEFFLPDHLRPLFYFKFFKKFSVGMLYINVTHLTDNFRACFDDINWIASEEASS